MAHLRTRIRTAASPVKRPPGTEELPRMRSFEKQPIPEASEAIEVAQASPNEIHRKAQSYDTIELVSSKGKKYRVTMPGSYSKYVPKVWSWNVGRLKAAELIASGFPISQVVQDPDVGISSRHVIYAWLMHPEFKEHVDALVLETGFASKRERIAGLTRLTQKLFDRLLNDADALPLTDRSVGAIITGVMQGMKQLGQEKEEFVEQQAITQDTTLKGSMTVAQLTAEDILKSKTDDERRALEAEFDTLGDDIIRNLTGGK